MKNKDFVFTDFIEMVRNSWTYGKMTEEERGAIHCLLLDYRTTENIKGTYQQRWNALNVVYSAYLRGIGYNGADWREKGDVEKCIF